MRLVSLEESCLNPTCDNASRPPSSNAPTGLDEYSEDTGGRTQKSSGILNANRSRLATVELITNCHSARSPWEKTGYQVGITSDASSR